jgi:minor extracellular serine protease Vpr
VTTTRTVNRAARIVLPGVVAGVLAASALAGSPAHAADEEVPGLHLVTLTGPGTSATPPVTGAPDAQAVLLARQDAVLETIGGPATAYRWTTALNGFAVELTADQVTALESNDDVAAIEANTVRPMAGHVDLSAVRFSRSSDPRASRGAGGSGVVIGFVDSGIAPDSPLFSEVRGLGETRAGFSGTCSPGEGWPASTCNRKVVGAGWWVEGFGPDRIRSSESLSALDVVGHGTQVASVAAGNSDVSVLMNGRTMTSFSGVAPQAKVAPYKACWAAPDPADDGCSTADLVSAIDQATADGVDVLNVAVAGPTTTDTVERALLGAAEADIVVVGAAGNGRSAFAAHASPWVTTVGAARGNTLRGRVSVVGGPAFTGASRSRRQLGPVALVLGADVAADGAPTEDARRCLPGSLDARQVAGRAVACLRGGIGRVDKSEAVALADGVAMVLVNDRPGALVDDFHTVPTVQLSVADGTRLTRWMKRHDRTTVRLAGVGIEKDASEAARWSAPGDDRASLLKPDVVALGEGVLGAVPDAWALFSGTSAASARASGVAALLRAKHGHWSASVVRSVLTTTARPLAGTSTLVQGAGRVRASLPRPGLALDIAPTRYRDALEDVSWEDLNVSSIIMRGGGTTTRRVTNLGTRAEYFSVSARGFVRHRVRTTPVALRLGPGESASVRITVTGGGNPSRFDDGWIVWRGARGSHTRIPVAISR